MTSNADHWTAYEYSNAGITTINTYLPSSYQNRSDLNDRV